MDSTNYAYIMYNNAPILHAIQSQGYPSYPAGPYQMSQPMTGMPLYAPGWMGTTNQYGFYQAQEDARQAQRQNNHDEARRRMNPYVYEQWAITENQTEREYCNQNKHGRLGSIPLQWRVLRGRFPPQREVNPTSSGSLNPNAEPFQPSRANGSNAPWLNAESIFQPTSQEGSSQPRRAHIPSKSMPHTARLPNPKVHTRPIELGCPNVPQPRRKAVEVSKPKSEADHSQAPVTGVPENLRSRTTQLSGPQLQARPSPPRAASARDAPRPDLARVPVARPESPKALTAPAEMTTSWRTESSRLYVNPSLNGTAKDMPPVQQWVEDIPDELTTCPIERTANVLRERLQQPFANKVEIAARQKQLVADLTGDPEADVATIATSWYEHRRNCRIHGPPVPPVNQATLPVLRSGSCTGLASSISGRQATSFASRIAAAGYSDVESSFSSLSAASGSLVSTRTRSRFFPPDPKPIPSIKAPRVRAR